MPLWGIESLCAFYSTVNLKNLLKNDSNSGKKRIAASFWPLCFFLIFTFNFFCFIEFRSKLISLFYLIIKFMKKSLIEKYGVFNAVAAMCDKSTGAGLKPRTLSAAFYADFDAVLQDLTQQYDWSTREGRTQAVAEQREFWEKLGKIAKSYSEGLESDKWYPIILRAFSTGMLPYSHYYLTAFKISPEDAAPYVSFYIGSYEMERWVVDNWDGCDLFKDQIAEAMDKGGFYNADLSEKCRSYSGLKFLFMLLFAVLIGYMVSLGDWYLFAAMPLGLIWIMYLISFRAETSIRKMKAQAKMSELGNA